jgi:hypothetical protein
MRTAFTEPVLVRLEGADGEFTSMNPTSAAIQAAVLGGDSALKGVETGRRHAEEAVTAANKSTESAIQRAMTRTGRSIRRTRQSVVQWLERRAKFR